MASLKKIARVKNWEYEKRHIYILKDGYYFTVEYRVNYFNSYGNGMYYYVPLLNITAEQKTAVVNYLKQNKRTLKVMSYEFSNMILVIRSRPDVFSIKSAKIENIILNLTKMLKELNIPNEAVCAFCKEGNANTTTKINGIMVPAHSSCVEIAKNEQVQNNLNQLPRDNHYFPGVLGSLIAVFITTIPWIILEVYWGYAGVLAILIAYSALFGYKKLGAAVTKSTKWLMIIPLLFSLFFSNLIMFGLLALADYKGWMSDFLSNLFTSVIFMLIGYFYILSRLRIATIGNSIK